MRLWLVLLSRIAGAALANDIAGDLLEQRARRAKRSRVAAAWWLWRTAAGLTGYALAQRIRLTVHASIAAGFGFRGVTLRHSVRALRRSPGFTIAVVLSLALSLGANTAMFTIVNAVLFRPLPYDRPAELIAIGQVFKADVLWGPYADFLPMWDGRTQSLAAISTFEGHNVAIAGAYPEYVVAGSAAPNLLQVLGVPPALGRWFTDADTVRGAPLVVVLGHAFWHRHFLDDPGAIGRTIKYQERTATVIGVMPAGVGLPIRAELWTPGGGAGSEIVARLRPGVTLSQVEPELSRLDTGAERMRKLGSPYQIVVVPLHDRLYGSARPALGVTFGAVGLLLLIACANIANLSLARAWRRRRDVTLRLALGASRWSLACGIFAEHLLLALSGGALGVALAVWMTRLFVRLSPDAIRRVSDIAIDARVVLFTAALSVIAAFVVSVVPALSAMRGRSLDDIPRGAGLAAGGRGGQRARRVLVAAQLATALVLLTGAGLFLRSIERLGQVPLGVDPRGVALARVSLPAGRYPDETSVRSFHARVRAQLTALPGVRSVALGPAPLVAGGREAQGFSDGFSWMLGLKDQGDGFDRVWGKYVDAQYFETYGIRVREGRGFAQRDDTAAPLVAIINRAAARHYFPGGHAIGGIVPLGAGPRSAAGTSTRLSGTVVGIVDDALQRDLTLRAEPEVFAPLSQQDFKALSSQTITVRGDDAAALVGTLSRIVREIDPELAVMTPRTLQAVIDESLAPHRFLLVLVGAFAALALGLASLGLYAVIAYLVVQRTPEIGVRLALGADRRQVLRIFLREGLTLALIGVAAGVPLAFGLGRIVETLLFGITPHDAWAAAGAPVVLLAIAALAVYVPARRATGVDPLPLLRHE